MLNMLRPLLVGLAILGYFPIGVCSEALEPEFDRRQSLAISQAAYAQYLPCQGRPLSGNCTEGREALAVVRREHDEVLACLVNLFRKL